MAALSDSFIQAQKAKPLAELLADAVRIHQDLAQAIREDRLDSLLESDAAALHEFFFSHVPAAVFAGYVNHVHTALDRPNWLAGRPGVSWHEYRL